MRLAKLSVLLILLLFAGFFSWDILVAEEFQEDSKWYEEARKRIDTLRRGPILIKVKDEEGNPLDNVNIELEMIRHAFGFGTAVGARELMDTTSQGETYRRVLKNNFNKATLENDLKWNV